jgi:XTP/dITP diphosphohydrolase
MPGQLLTEPRGSNGFGYDPLFLATGQSQSNGELTSEQKDAISHRGKAVRQIVPVLIEELNRAADQHTTEGQS